MALNIKYLSIKIRQKQKKLRIKLENQNQKGDNRIIIDSPDSSGGQNNNKQIMTNLASYRTPSIDKLKQVLTRVESSG